MNIEYSCVLDLIEHIQIKINQQNKNLSLYENHALKCIKVDDPSWIDIKPTHFELHLRIARLRKIYTQLILLKHGIDKNMKQFTAKDIELLKCAKENQFHTIENTRGSYTKYRGGENHQHNFTYNHFQKMQQYLKRVEYSPLHSRYGLNNKGIELLESMGVNE